MAAENAAKPQAPILAAFTPARRPSRPPVAPPPYTAFQTSVFALQNRILMGNCDRAAPVSLDDALDTNNHEPDHGKTAGTTYNCTCHEVVKVNRPAASKYLTSHV